MASWRDRVRDTSTTTGTGAFAVSGTPPAGYGAFSRLNLNVPIDYVIEAVDGSGVPTGDWESGAGFLTSSTSLTRSFVYENSLGTTALINFSAGSKNVFITWGAKRIESNLSALLLIARGAFTP
jgi:hypothetical protein